MAVTLQKIGELGSNWKRWTSSGQYPGEIKDGQLYVRYISSNSPASVGIVSGSSPYRGDLTTSEVWVTNAPPR